MLDIWFEIAPSHVSLHASLVFARFITPRASLTGPFMVIQIIRQQVFSYQSWMDVSPRLPLVMLRAVALPADQKLSVRCTCGTLHIQNSFHCIPVFPPTFASMAFAPMCIIKHALAVDVRALKLAYTF